MKHTHLPGISNTKQVASRPAAFKNWLTFFSIMALMLSSMVGWGQILWSSSAGSAWLTGTNWTGGAVPNSSQIAQFGANPTGTSAGINFSSTTNAGTQTNGSRIQEVGAVEITTARTASLTITNSTGTGGANGTFRLLGTTVNSVANTVLRNTSGQTLSLANGGTANMGVVFSNSTNNIISVEGAGGITISAIISGTGNITKTGTGNGVLLLSGANTYTAVTTISAGTLRLGAVNAIPVATTGGGVVLGGGTLSTGATTGFSDGSASTNMGTLTLTSSSTIALGTGSHSIYFAASNAVSWTSGQTLTITGWTGTVGAGTTGTAGKFFVGSSASGLTAAQLAQIRFSVSGVTYNATQLSTGEVVPALNYVITSISPASPTAGSGFSVTVEAQDAGGTARSVSASGSTFSLTTNGNAGAISGTTTGTIPASSSSVTVTGVILASAGTGVTLTATRTSGDIVLPGTSATFSVASSGGAAPPSLTPAAGATVDAPFDITFTDDATWRTSVTSITVNGTTLATGAYSLTTAGQITFTPSASTLLQTPGSKTIVITSTGYTSATVSQSIAVGAPAKLSITTQPAAPATNGAVLATQPVIAILDQYNNATTSTASVTAAVGAGTWTLGGTTTVNAVSGTATFSGLTATSAAAVTGATISFSSGSLTGATSNTFNIPAPAPANDLCTNATLVIVGAAAISGTTVAATLTTPFTTGVDVWYTFTPSCTGTATVSTTQTAQDIDLTVWSASCPAATSGNINTGGNSTSTTSESTTLSVTAGTPYFVRVRYFSGTQGTFTIAVTNSATPQFTLANTGTPAAANIGLGVSNVALFGFALTPNACTNSFNFTDASIATSGTATSSDLSNFRLIVDANANGQADAGEISSPIGTVSTLANPLVFTAITGQTGITAVRRYLLIADVAAGATDSRTFSASLAAAGVTANVAVTGSAAGNTQTIVALAPTLVADPAATVDAPFVVTFTDNAAWRAAITGITVGGTALTAGFSVSAGAITFTPSASVPAAPLQTATSRNIVVTATGYSNTSVVQVIGAGAPTQLVITTQPTAPASNGGAFATQPVVVIRDQYGNLTNSTATVTAAVGAGSWTIGGTTGVNAVAGTATFSGLTATTTATISGATISFSSPGLSSATSNTMTLPGPAPVNDLCGNATVLTVGAAAVSGTTISSTVSAPFTGDPDVWYTFTPSCTGTAVVSTTTTSQDIDLFVWSGGCPVATTGTIGTGGSTSSSLTTESVTAISVTAGTQYFVRVKYFSTTSGSVPGSFNISVTNTVNPTFTLANTGTPATGTVASNTSNAVLYGFALSPNSGACGVFTYNFTAANITTSGTATSSDLSNFRLIVDANANGVADAGEIAAPVGTVSTLGTTLSFTVSGQTGLTAVRRYLLIADVAAGATGGATFTASLTAANTTTTATVSGTATGNAQTITTSSITIADNSQVTSGTVVRGTTNNIVSRFQVSVSGTNSTVTNMAFVTAGISGGYTSADIVANGFKLWVSTTNSFGTATQVGTGVSSAKATATSTETLNFTSSQTLISGVTYFYWLTVDVAATATTARTITINAFSSITATGTAVSGSAAAAGAQTIVAPTLTIANNTQVTAGTLFANTTNNVISRAQFSITNANVTVTSVSFVTAANAAGYTSADIAANGFKLWVSTTNSFASATQVGSGVSSTKLSGNTTETITFATTQPLLTATTYFYWLTVDVSAAATNGDVIIVNGLSAASVVSSTTGVSIAGTTTAAGTQTISTPTITLANTGTPAAGLVSIGTSNAVLFGFALTPNTTADFTAATITVAGTVTASDVSNFRLLQDANSNGLADAGEIAAPIGTATLSAGALAFTSVSGQTGFSAVRRYLLIADVASNATAQRTFTGSLTSANVTATITVSGSAAGNTQTFVNVPAAGEIVINQFNYGYSAATDEYIELVNTTNKVFDLSQLKISYASTSGGSGSAGGTLSGVLQPYSFWLLATQANVTFGQTSALVRDGSFNSGLASGGGQIALALLNDTKIDGVGYGTMTGGTFFETSSIATVSANGYRRITDGVDNNNNSTDFQVATSGTVYLRNSTGRLAPANSTVAAGTYRDLVVTGNTSLNGDVTVNTSTRFLSGDVTIGSNTLTLNGTITRTSGNLVGSRTSNLTLGSAAGTLFFSQTGTGNFLKNFTINNGASATLGNALNITAGLSAGNEGLLQVNGTGVLNTGGFLTIKSNQFGTAAIGPNTTGGTYINGNVTIERFISTGSGSKAWRLLASNTTGQTIKNAWQEGQAAMATNTTGFGTMITGRTDLFANEAAATAAGFDKRTNGSSILYQKPSADRLWPVLSTNIDIATYPSYFLYVRGDRSADFTGANTTATTTPTLRSTGSIFMGDQTVNVVRYPSDSNTTGFTFSRNPYASAVDMSVVMATRSAGVSGTFQVWDPKISGTYGLGGYQTFTLSGSTFSIAPGGGSYGNSGKIIESGTGIIFQGNGTVTFQEVAKVTGSTLTQRPSNGLSAAGEFRTTLYANNTGSPVLADGNLLLVDDSYDNALDQEDARKNTNFGENFGILKDSVAIAIEKRKMPVAGDTVFFRMSRLKAIGYSLVFEPATLPVADVAAFLVDRYTNTQTPVDLLSPTTYNFSVDANAASSASNRFYLVFRPQSPLPVNFTSVRAAQAGANIAVEWKVANQLNIARYEVMKSTDGRNFTTAGTVAALANNAGELTYNWLDVQASAGANYYRVKSVDINGTTRYTSIVKVLMGKVAASVVVMPNPVKGNVINLQLSSTKAGTYNIRLLNTAGQLLMSKKAQHAGGNASQTFTLPSTVVNGVYQLEVVLPDNSKHIQKLIIDPAN